MEIIPLQGYKNHKMEACLNIRKISNFNYTTKLSTFLTSKISSLSKFTTINMEPHQKSKRPTCQTCSKPLSVCFCTRLKTPNLDNKVHVTILQHSLEKKHPLNSARIAKLGLKNVHVYTVTDVMYEAQFDIQPLGLDNAETFPVGEECTLRVCQNAPESLDFAGSLGVERCRKSDFDQVSELDSEAGSVGVVDSVQFLGCLQENGNEIVDFPEQDHLRKQNGDDSTSKVAKNQNDNAVLSVTVGKYGDISSISHSWKLQDEGKTPNLEHLIASPEVVESLAGGFVVTKLQKKQKCGCTELEQFEEFRIIVPPGSALLFPAQKAVSAEAIGYEVKNLIVLDGTWAKANRMYNENPWLKFLPSVRLDVEKLSMFNEVRRQPKPGYLSTIESIVYALEALGGSEKLEGLDNILDVFESMVEDQRRYKIEGLKKKSSM